MRNLDTLARIAVVPQEFPRLVSLRETITTYIKQIGFRSLTLDLEGYRSGNLYEVLPQSTPATLGEP